MKLSLRRWFFVLIGIVLTGFLLIQLVPYGKDQTNPPVVLEPEWDSSQTQQMVEAACYDCHSNRTQYPWYAKIAPASWLLASDISRARNAFNFNEMTPEQGQFMVDLMVKRVQEASMPPYQYQAIHPESRFSSRERQELIEGLLLTFKK